MYIPQLKALISQRNAGPKLLALVKVPSVWTDAQMLRSSLPPFSGPHVAENTWQQFRKKAFIGLCLGVENFHSRSRN